MSVLTTLNFENIKHDKNYKAKYTFTAKATNPQLEDENHYEIRFKRLDFFLRINEFLRWDFSFSMQLKQCQTVQAVFCCSIAEIR